MLQLIGAGYGRTGTDSTKEALNLLGLRCYHMREVISNPANRHHLDFWCRVADGAPGAMKKEIRSMVKGAYAILALAGAGILGALAVLLSLL